MRLAALKSLRRRKWDRPLRDIGERLSCDHRRLRGKEGIARQSFPHGRGIKNMSA